MKSKLCKAVAAFLVIAGLAGCATEPQEPLWDKLDRLLWYNAAD